MQTIAANEMSGQLLDIADDGANAAIDRQLIAAVGFQSGIATSRFDRFRMSWWVCVPAWPAIWRPARGNDKWNVSAYETIQNLARISVLPTHPATHVRLDEPSA